MAIPAPKSLIENLEKVREWVKTRSTLPECRNNDDFMELALEVMTYTDYLLKTGLSLVPLRGGNAMRFTKRRAIALGHLVRLYKLYDAFALHVSRKEREIGMILFRLILESAVKLEYLMKSDGRTFRHFVLISYRSEKESLADLKAKAKRRPLIPIEKRMLRSMKSHLARDGIRETELAETKSWNLDGKDFRKLMAEVGYPEWGYSFGFGNGSHFVHGDWRDLDLHHLERRGRFYEPKWEYSVPDPRLVCSATDLCLRALFHYLKWNRSDPDKFVRPLVQDVNRLNWAIDLAHESYLQREH